MHAMESGAAPHTVGELARDVLAAVQPEQLEAYDEVAAAWWAGEFDDDGAVSWSAGTVSSGLNLSDTLVYLVLPIVSGAIAQVLGSPADRALRRLRLRRRRRADLELTAALLGHAEEVRQACLDKAVTAGVPAKKAALIADAAYAALCRAAAQRLSQSHGPAPSGADA